MGPPPPPWPTPEASAPKGHAGLLVAGIAVLALLLGAVVGYVVGVPQRNSLKDDKAAVEAQLTDTQRQLASAQSELDTTKSQLGTATTGAAAKGVCLKAATDANDLLDQWENWLNDFVTYMQSPAGSAAEAQIQTHMTDQEGQMTQQTQVVRLELLDCQTKTS